MTTPSKSDPSNLSEMRDVLSSDSSDSASGNNKFKVAVIISGATGAATGANGNYSRSTQVIDDKPLYQQIEKGGTTLVPMHILYDGVVKDRWVVTNSVPRDSETRVGYIAGIDCPTTDRKCDFSVLSDKTDWYILDESGATMKGNLEGMKATVDPTVKPAERETASSAESSSSSASQSSVSSSPAAATPTVVVETPKTIVEMRDIYSKIDTQYNYISPRFKQLTADSKIDAIKSFETELDTKIEELRVARQQLESFKNSSAQSGQAGGGSSSSSSKKNRKSHKSYHPDIGKTRKHSNSHDEPKRVSFVHHA